jgi:DNA-binding NtrC family response regulator
MKNASSLVSPATVSSNSFIPHVLIVDDESTIRHLLRTFYKRSGYTASSVASGEEALAKLAQGNIDLVITDIQLPGMSGTELVANMKENFPDVPVMAITGYSDIDIAINVLKNGACDFIIKPFNLDSLQESTHIALEKTLIDMEMRHLRRSLTEGYEFRGMLSKTPEMHRIFEIVRAVAPTEMTVSIEGETGTGKELLASAVHSHSNRRNKPFITINCAGFPESLLESELFGYEKGAFTGAVQSKAGKIELALVGDAG